MKKQIVTVYIVLFVFIFFAGCTASTVKRGMLTDNTYYSAYSPNIQIKIIPDFTYRTGKAGKMKHQFINSKDRKFIYIHRYPHMADESQVDYYHNPAYWIFNHIPRSSRIESGPITILGKEWYYCNSIQHFSGNCAIIRDISRFTVDHDVFRLRYVKMLPSYGCANWKNVNMLTPEQREFISNFIADLSKDIEMKNYIIEPTAH